jgi:hypothetical protein
MKPYMRLRKFVDWDLSKTGAIRSGAATLLIAMAIASAPFIVVEQPFSANAWAAICLAFAASLAWLAFVAWRGYRLLRAHAIKGDRKFDLRDKHRLHEEYASTESATKARVRR